MNMIDLTVTFDRSEVEGTARLLGTRLGKTSSGREYTVLKIETANAITEAWDSPVYGVPHVPVCHLPPSRTRRTVGPMPGSERG